MGSRRWASSEGVQARILDAALKVFSERGYAEASMADIVREAEISIGSIYHHFGGKEELFLALADQFRDIVRERIAASPDDWERAFLEATWECRDLYRILCSPDTPPTYSATQRFLEVLDDAGLVNLHNGPMPHTLAAILVETSTYLANLDNESAVAAIIASGSHWCRVVKVVGYKGDLDS